MGTSSLLPRNPPSRRGDEPKTVRKMGVESRIVPPPPPEQDETTPRDLSHLEKYFLPDGATISKYNQSTYYRDPRTGNFYQLDENQDLQPVALSEEMIHAMQPTSEDPQLAPTGLTTGPPTYNLRGNQNITTPPKSIGTSEQDMRRRPEAETSSSPTEPL